MSGTDPLLGSLANNGGPTRTFALLAGSPAIDAGDDATCNAAPVSGLDQRGIARPQGAHCDIGAYESLHLAISGNAGVGGATLHYGAGSTSADGSGNYSFTVSDGWSGTVIPAEPGYTFAPDHIDYPGVTTDQPSQNYIATPLTPPVPRIYPPSGSQVCPTPQVGADLMLTNRMRKNGSFDPSTITLKLDGTDVTGSTSSLQTMTSPASLARVIYTPPTLSVGAHDAELTYPLGSGTQTLQWSFTVAAIPCPSTGGTHGPESDETPPSSPDSSPADRRDIDNP
jgi:hypothetical protein